MSKKNNQSQDLLAEFKSINDQARKYLDEAGKKIAALDLKYAQGLVKHDINIMKAAKAILEKKKK
jgi:hypothetical protein